MHGRRDLGPGELNQLQHASGDIRDRWISEKNGMQGSIRCIEQLWPVSFDFSILQNLEAHTIPVEEQAGFKITHREHGVMERTRHDDLLVCRCPRGSRRASFVAPGECPGGYPGRPRRSASRCRAVPPEVACES